MSRGVLFQSSWEIGSQLSCRVGVPVSLTACGKSTWSARERWKAENCAIPGPLGAGIWACLAAAVFIVFWLTGVEWMWMCKFASEIVWIFTGISCQGKQTRSNEEEIAAPSSVSQKKKKKNQQQKKHTFCTDYLLTEQSREACTHPPTTSRRNSFRKDNNTLERRKKEA